MVSLVSTFYNAAGITVASFGGSAAVFIATRAKIGLPTRGLRAAAGGFAYLVTAEIIKTLVDESHPFWRGVTTATPIILMQVGKIIGTEAKEALIHEQDSEILGTKEYEKASNQLSHSVKFALACGFTNIFPTTLGSTVAGLLGTLLGESMVESSVATAREARKKAQ